MAPVTDERDGAPDRSPGEQLADLAADLFVYAPIGWFFEAPRLLPKLAEQGRVHTRNARLFGQFAVRQGEAEVRRRLAGFEEQTSGLLRALGLLPDDRGATNGAEAPAPAPPAATSPGAQQARQAAPRATEPGPAVDDLAITDYDSLSASHVVTRLPGGRTAVRSRAQLVTAEPEAPLGTAPEEAARTAVEADIPHLVELAGAAAEEKVRQKGGAIWARREGRPAPREAALRLALQSNDHEVAVGTLDGAIVGYGAARVETLLDGGRLGVIDDIYVDPGARAVGVGEALMNHLLDWCTARGCFGVDSLALPGDRETKNFFESFGLVARAIVVHRPLG